MGMGCEDDSFAELIGGFGTFGFGGIGREGEFFEVRVESYAEERIYGLGSGGDLLEEGHYVRGVGGGCVMMMMEKGAALSE